MYGQFFVLFALMFTGYFCRRLDIIDNQINRGLNRFILYLTLPCLIIHKMANLEMAGSLLNDFFLCFGLTAAALAVFCAYSRIYARLRKFPSENSNVAELCMVLPNNAFMGFPIALIFFGEQGLFLMLAHNTAMNLCLFSYGVYLMGRNGEKRPLSAKGILQGLAKLFFNPNLLAMIAGFCLSLFHVPVPAMVNEYLLYLGNVTTPMSMLLIGSSLVGSSFVQVVRDHVAVEATVNKLFVLPALAGLAVVFLPVSGMMKAILILGMLFPTAAMCAMVTREHGQDVTLAGRIIFLSTIVSIVTLPLGINFINAFIL